MKILPIHILRILSYIALPIGEYLAAWPMSIPPITNILKPITPTDLRGEIAVIVLLIAIPIIIILFLLPKKEDQRMEVSQTWLGSIQRPTFKELLKNISLLVVLTIIGALPLIFWTIIVLIITYGVRP